MTGLEHLSHTELIRLAEDPDEAPDLIERFQREQQRLVRAAVELSSQDERALTNFERRFASQNGEDGIIEEIFRRIGLTNRQFVEFGVEDGSVNNTRRLLDLDWRGIWFEGDHAFAEAARQGCAHLPIQILERFITVENCRAVFDEALAPAEMDLLSIDIDGNDYWVWKQLGTHYRPRIVVIEYNAAFLPEERWIMPYNPNHRWDGTRQYGASLASLSDLATQLNYSLVACDSQGVNAFFVRDDLLGGAFAAPRDVIYHYRAPRFSFPWMGHPPSPSAWLPLDPPYQDDLAAASASWASPPPASVRAAAFFDVAITLRNDSQWPIRSTAAYSAPEVAQEWNGWRKPPWLTALWIDMSGEPAPIRKFISYIAPACAPLSAEWYGVTAQAPERPGTYSMSVCLVHTPEHIQKLLETPVEVE